MSRRAGEDRPRVVGRPVAGVERVGERWLRVAKVELSAPGTGDVHEQAVEGIQPVVDELAQEPTGLRGPEGQDVVMLLAEMEAEVAEREQSGADDGRQARPE